MARDTSGSTVIVLPYTSAWNRAARIPEGRSATKVEWVSDQCSEHFSSRFKGKAGTKRPIRMTCVKPLAGRFYQIWSGHALTGVYL